MIKSIKVVLIFLCLTGIYMPSTAKSSVGQDTTKAQVKECNNILNNRNIKKRFTLKDRYNLTKSKEMFVIIQSFFNPTNDVEKAIRSWNGGPKYSKSKTQRYYEKVMKQLRNQ